MNTSRFGSRSLLAILFVIGLLISVGTARSESDLEKALRQYNFEAVKGYIQPIADLFGANINAGMYHSAAIPTMGFHLAVELIGMASVVSDDQKSYDVKLPVGFTIAGTSLKTATVFGGKGTLFQDVRNGVPSGLTYKGSDGIVNTSLFPLAVPQLTVGYVYGTEATIRFMATPEIQKFPTTTLFGIGARHSVSQYIADSPIDLAVGVFYNKFKVGDLIDFNAIAFGAQASKKFAVLVLYGGLQSEKSTMNLKYNSSDPSQPPAVNIDLDGANTFRATVGAGLDFGVFKIFADANVGSITSFSGGIGLGF